MRLEISPMGIRRMIPIIGMSNFLFIILLLQNGDILNIFLNNDAKREDKSELEDVARRHSQYSV